MIKKLSTFGKCIPKELFVKVSGLLMLSIFLSITEGVGILLLVPLVELAGIPTGESGALPGFLATILQKTGIELTLVSALLLYIGIITFFAILKFLQSYFSMSLSEGMIKTYKNRLFSQLIRSRWSYISSKKSSDILHILSSRVSVYGAMMHSVSAFVLALTMLIVYGSVAAVISVPMTIFAIGSGLVITLLLRPLNKKIHLVGKHFFESNKDLYSILKESVEGIKTTKSYGLEKQTEETFNYATTAIMENMLRYMKLSLSTQALYKIGSVITISLIFYIAIVLFHLDAVRLLLFILIFSRVIPQISNLHTLYQNFLNSLPSLTEVESLLIESGAEAEQHIDSLKTLEVRNVISLRDISFAYTDTGSFGLQKINLDIKQGTHTAIIGHTASGKSTLIDLLMGLLTPQCGTITVDGKPLMGNRFVALRKSIAYVPQIPFLFHDSIMNNITIVKKDAVEKDIWRVLELVEAKDMVEALPEGLDTIIGDKGVALSGGERQRLSLARALIINPQILILDEATNALDNAVEARVLRSLCEKSGIKTFITITHKTSGLYLVDTLVVLKSGHIVAQGSLEDVKKSQNPYVQGLFQR